ncbi:MAG: glycosyl transferase family [Geobacteraceae bacterium]|nr:MAG: glycosyl transferase family [Geobacteraceae bacterium]
MDNDESMAGYSNILIIKPGAIGDLLHITPVIREVKRSCPESRITLIVGSRATAALFDNHPHVYETIVFDKRGEHRSLPALAKLWRRLRSARYDLVLNFQRSNLKAWLLVSAAFPSRVLIYHKTRKRMVHAVINHWETIAPLGIRPTDMHLDFYPSPAAIAFADEYFTRHGLDGKVVVAINPGASNRIKCWSPRRFAELGDRVTEELGAAVMIVGGKEERDLADAIRAGMRVPPLDLLGKTTLPQLGAILRRCNVVVSGDTGPMHMATAVGTPVVALFGAIDPRRTGPVGNGHRVIQHKEIECVPCNAKSCANSRYLECMEKITADEVFHALAEMLEKDGGTP